MFRNEKNDDDDDDDENDDGDFEAELIQALGIASPYVPNDATTVAADQTITLNIEQPPGSSTPKRK